MWFLPTIVLISAALFVAMVALEDAGWRLGRARMAATGAEHAAIGAVEASLFALTGLLVAFTFGGAAERFEHRRTLITEEVNAIETAYKKLDVVGADARVDLRAKMRDYVSQRLAVSRALPDVGAAHQWIERSERTQDEIWSVAVPATRAAGGSAQEVLLPSLTAMFDMATTRWLATQSHPPIIVFVMLGVLCLLSAFAVGLVMASAPNRSRVLVYLFAAGLAMAVFVILDLEYPRFGVIRIDAAESNMARLLEKMR
jgi:hypothetical protein